jgi:regulator of protease activity HflC (stomatin/prohibitin superfamily)
MDSQSTKATTYSSTGGAIAVILIITAIFTAVGAALASSISVGLIVGIIVFFFMLAMSIRIINEWNRMAVLRFGQFRGIIGPGIYSIIPFIESTPVTVDLRVISTTFRAEKTLTMDNVPVDVDAILFWKVVNPEHSILNVQSYYDSVQLAAQTAMRDIIGKSNLSNMLAGRDVIGEDIKNLIEDRVENWGIEAISVEIRDVTIPDDLQNAMARVATSEREKMARVTLAESESLAADKMLEASNKYKTDLFAMQLRSLNMMYEISLNGKNLIVFIPTESGGFSIPTPFGLAGLQEMAKKASKPDQQPAKPKKDER